MHAELLYRPPRCSITIVGEGRVDDRLARIKPEP